MDNTAATLPAETIAQLAVAGLAPREIHQVPMIIIPPGHKLESMKHLLPKPLRIEARQCLTTPQSFIDYFQQFADDRSVIMACEETSKIVAIFDYHKPNQPENCDHTATLVLTKSPEWESWKGNNGRAMKQRDFAEFIENHIADVRIPSGAELLEVAKTLQATKNIKFRSSTELHNGQVQLTYNEEINGQAGTAGSIEIPRQITIGVRIFKGQEAYAVTARLRYRITDDAGLLFSYHINDLDKITEDAFQTVLTQIKTNCKAALTLSV